MPPIDQAPLHTAGQCNVLFGKKGAKSYNTCESKTELVIAAFCVVQEEDRRMVTVADMDASFLEVADNEAPSVVGDETNAHTFLAKRSEKEATKSKALKQLLLGSVLSGSSSDSAGLKFSLKQSPITKAFIVEPNTKRFH
uniref:Uncharacterized protein n=1 Tax=Parascaris univalens TaxID=6257 RepID=A0A915C1K2_PARUN